MIIINKGQINNIALSLQSVTYSPKYLFSLTNDITNVAVNFIVADTSTSTAYQKFAIEETTSTNLYTGKVQLNPSGFWTYNIYAQTSSTNLEPSLALNFLETGKVSVVSTYSIDNIYQYQILPTYQPDYIKLRDLADYVTTSDLTSYVTTSDLTSYATDTELTNAISAINTSININEDYILSDYRVILVDTTNKDVTISDASPSTNSIYTIKKVNGSNNVLFNFNIDGSAYTISTLNDSITIIYNNGWYII